MTLLLCAILLSAPEPSSGPVLAIVPPVGDQADTAWVGLALADDIETRLLEHSVFDSAAMRDTFPVSIFGWRQMLSAARQANVDAGVLLSAKDGARLGKAVGATAVLTATYALKSSSIRVIWRLVGDTASNKRDFEIRLDAIPHGIERLFAGMLSDLGLTSAGVPFNPLPELPLSAFRAYGEALLILRDQSLDPRAQLVLGSDRLAEAHLLLAEATTEAPLFQRAWATRAVVSAMLGNSTRAEEELEEAKGAGNIDAPAVALARFYLECRKGELDRGIMVLGRALNAHLGFTLGLGYLGQAYLQGRRFEEAVKLFTLYSSRVPNNPWVATMRAEALARVGRNDLAQSELEALARRFPSSLVVLAGLAARQAESWRFKEARRTLAKGLELAPGSPQLSARLAQVEMDEGLLDKGMALAQQATKGVDESRGEPMAGFPHLVLGRALALAGRSGEAFDAFRTAARLGIDPYELKSFARDARLNDIVRDPRFPPVQPEELDQLEIEISVLTEPQQLHFNSPEELLSQLQPYRDGVLLRIGATSATYLPQVWAQIPDKATFLNKLCQKAGCEASAWKNPETAVYTYGVESFEEFEP